VSKDGNACQPCDSPAMRSDQGKCGLSWRAGDGNRTRITSLEAHRDQTPCQPAGLQVGAERQSPSLVL